MHILKRHSQDSKGKGEGEGGRGKGKGEGVTSLFEPKKLPTAFESIGIAAYLVANTEFFNLQLHSFRKRSIDCLIWGVNI